jgi:hypothetical protein
VLPNAVVCLNCGGDVRSFGGQMSGSGAAGNGQKSKFTAGILGLLLGALGVHRFYLGYTTIGVIQIVLTVCTFGIAGLWGTIEGVLIFTGTIATDAQGRPLADY